MENLTTVEPDFSGLIKVPAVAPKEMLSVRIENGKTIVRINSSSLGLIQTCARKSFYLLHEKWRAKAGSPALIYGSAYHKALEVFYRHPATERELPENFEQHALVMAQGYDAPAKHFLYDAVRAFVAEAEPLRMLPDEDKRSLSSGIWSLTHYFKTYLSDNYVIHSDDKGPMIERPFSLVLVEDDKFIIELFGTIDFALKNIITGEVLVGDHKTTSMMGYDFMARVKPNHQYTGYLLGAQQVFGISGENFLVNGIEVKARPKTARGGPPKFIRQITRRTPEDFAEFKTVVQWAVAHYMGWRNMNEWPLGPVDACSMYGGCGFHDICSAPNELRSNILESKFQKEQHAST